MKTHEEAWDILDARYRDGRMQYKCLRSHNIDRDTRTFLSIEVKLKADDNLVEKLAANYLCTADKAPPDWDVFDGWLGEEEAVARVTRLEVLLTSNDTIQTNSKQQKSGQSRHPAKVPLWSSCCQHETHNCGEQG